MTFLEQLQSHKGGLLWLKTELFWYGGRGYDRSPDRVCLILDATRSSALASRADRDDAETPTAEYPDPDVLLLIDGSPHWVWMAAEDVELL
jgi:hypothetical protein